MVRLQERDWVDAVIDEYKLVRAESLAAIDAQQKALAFGAAAVGVVVGAGGNFWDQKVLASALFFAAPVVVLFVLLFWWAEFVRMLEAWSYLSYLEAAASSKFPTKPEWLLSR